MKILICENEDVLLTALKFRLTKRGYELFLAKTGKEATQYLLNENIDFVITELHLPNSSASVLLKLAHQNINPNLPFIIISDIENADELLDILAKGANDFLLKPFRPDELLLRIEKIKSET